MEQEWFLNGHHWTLGVLQLCGVAVDETKLREILQELRDGSLSTMDTLTERIEGIGPNAEMCGIQLSAADMQSIADTIRSVDSDQRGVARKRDKECASLVLDFQEGRWPKLD